MLNGQYIRGWVTPRRAARSCQRGVMMIEALVAILIFSLGVLGLIGLQATSLKHISDAKYRIDAAALAEQLISQMWAENHTTAVLQSNYGATTASGYATWAALVARALPGVNVDENKNLPSVSIQADSSDSLRSTVTVVVYWQPPGTDAAHNYTAVSRIR